MGIAETIMMAGFLFCQPAGTKAMSIKGMRMISPYQITPSKKGSFPTGVTSGHSGSRTKVPNLPRRARKITPSVNAMRKFRNEKSMRTLKAFLEMFLLLNLMDLPAVVYGRVVAQALGYTNLQKGNSCV